MIKVSVVGATGYAGSELVRLIYSHPQAEITAITSHSYVNKPYKSVYSNFGHLENLVCEDDDLVKLSKKSDVIFLALPHGIASSTVTQEVLDNCKVIDLGADFRLDSKDTYESWYGVKHMGADVLKQAVYGLCEINRDKINGKTIVANPGCYTTCSILCLYPLLKEGIISNENIYIDAKSGVSGAGRGVNLDVHFDETNENIKAYKIASHRHTPEIEQELSKAASSNITLTFTPHLIPMNRGILATCYTKLADKYTWEDINAIYNQYYGNEFFVRLLAKGESPQTKWVKGSNFCDIGFAIDERTNTLIVIGALDNLVKGAAGQAIQNMNILFGLDEKMGLDYIPIFPA